jgi:hypothetical protein
MGRRGEPFVRESLIAIRYITSSTMLAHASPAPCARCVPLKGTAWKGSAGKSDLVRFPHSAISLLLRWGHFGDPRMISRSDRREHNRLSRTSVVCAGRKVAFEKCDLTLKHDKLVGTIDAHKGAID